MSIIDARLCAGRHYAGDAKEIEPLPPTGITSIHHSAIGLLNSITIDWIIEKEGEVGKQVESVILAVCIGEELPSGRRVIVIVQPTPYSEMVFPPSDGSIAPKRSIVPSVTARSGISPDAFHCDF